MKDPEMLERYIQSYEKLNPAYDDETLVKARKTLAALDAKEGTHVFVACKLRLCLSKLHHHFLLVSHSFNVK